MSFDRVFLDFETFSYFPIEYGLSRYARHSTTDIICLAYRIGSNVGFYVPDYLSGHTACPGPLSSAIDLGLEFHAFNAMFEGLIWENVCVKRYGWPAIPSQLWHCTMAKAAYSNLPRGMDKAGKALGLTNERKLAEGKKLVKLCCLPDKDTGKRNFDPVALGKLFVYNKQDVVAELAIDRDTLPVPHLERQIWQLDQKINKTGVPIDLTLCNGAVKILNVAQKEANLEMARLTEGRVMTTDEVPKIKDFLAFHGQLDKWKDEKGRTKYGKLDARAIEEKTADPNFHPLCKKVLELRSQFASASVKKMRAALNWTDDDGRCRCTLKYFTAGPGRWAGSGPQFQNMIRAKTPPLEVLALIAAGDYAKLAAKVGDVVKAISQASRAIIKAPEGRTFVLSDFSGIEARVCAWFAGEEKLLSQFREKQDVYVTMACDIFGVPNINGPDGKPIKEKRQMGKVPFLGAQYQMGWSKLIFTALTQAGVLLGEEDARNIIDVFRTKYDKIPDFWRALEDGAKACVHSGKEIVVNEFISYRMITHNYRNWMAMRLPSGRDIYYFEPKLGRDGGRWNLSYLSPKGIKQLYGGLLCENAVQGSSRDLMAEAMIRVNASGRKIILTVHDEIVCEIPLDICESESRIIHGMMETKPLWAVSLPLSAETHASTRFDK